MTFSFYDVPNTESSLTIPESVYCLALHTRDFQNGTFKIRIFSQVETEADNITVWNQDKVLGFFKNQAFVVLFDGRSVPFIETFSHDKFFKIALSESELDGYKHLMLLPSKDIWSEIAQILVPPTNLADKGWPLDGFELFEQMRPFKKILISKPLVSSNLPLETYTVYKKALIDRKSRHLIGIIYRNGSDVPLEYYNNFDEINDLITLESEMHDTYLVWSYACHTDLAELHEYRFIEVME